MEIVRTICKEKLDSKTRAPPVARVRGFCDIYVGRVIAFTDFLLCGFSPCAKPWAWRAEVFPDGV